MAPSSPARAGGAPADAVPRLFGTDGVRGPAGTVLTADLALRLGRAAGIAAREARTDDRSVRLLVVRDPRASGSMLEAAFAAGAAAEGADVDLAGVLPTPAAALLVRERGYDAAAVVSASHNPFADNGIKLFGPDGRKLADDREARVAELVAAPPDPGTAIGRVAPLADGAEAYLAALDARFGALDLSGLRIALDCANGAASAVGPEALRRRGAEVVVVGDAPDGTNINAGVGSTHPAAVRALVAEHGCDLGFALDGDADRILAVDHAGEEHDGDALLALLAVHLRDAGRLAGGLAVTVMSNLGLHEAMAAAGIPLAVTPVGDRHVIAALDEHGWNLGGEQSGHLIETGFVPSGDGLAAALLVLEALGGDRLADRRAMRSLPQVLVNVRVADRDGAMADAGFADAVARAEGAFADAGRPGRVLVRASGTEQLVRVMVEAGTGDEAAEVAERLAAAVPGRV